MKKYILFLVVLITVLNTYSQVKNDTVTLNEVIVLGNRIEIPFSKNSRSISIISNQQLTKSGVTNLADALQQIAGVDIRRRGIEGMQSDLYIRGGSFDQTLVLIDGIKMDDAQTGHHSMNAIIPIENIERIEIIKGPAARIYGQNAFTGAINIVTKKVENEKADIKVSYGSFETRRGVFSYQNKFKNGNSVFASLNKQTSDGYRFNTDFNNTSFLVKSTINSIDFISTYTERKFGANGFYASPDYIDQYEETQTSLLATSTQFKANDFTIKPRIYWRRNQDMYLFLRENPSYFRNLHISNKVGSEINIEGNTSLGKLGVGLDVSRIFLVSNNLGNHQRTTITTFLEHRFEFFDSKLDITPGIALNYFSDFDTQFFPGIDIGFELSNISRIYASSGYTYRVPTFTDLYYVGPTTIGNPDLKPEYAFSNELGYKNTSGKTIFDVAFFSRISENLIDWTKDEIDAKWETRNFSNVLTTGFETSFTYLFNSNNSSNSFTLSYTYINDDIKDVNVRFTRYSLNSMKHQFTNTLNLKLAKSLTFSANSRFIERTDGVSYFVVDSNIQYRATSKLSFLLNGSNLTNERYFETNLVPMPLSNFRVEIFYQF